MARRSTGPATLAERPDLRIVDRRAELTRKLIAPLMKRSFTRRVVLGLYQIVLPRPGLPRDLGVRPTPVWEPLDDSLWRAEDRAGFQGSGGRPQVLRHAVTGELGLFKSGETCNLTVPSQGIDAASQPIRAGVAADIANDLFGVASPRVRLVEYQGVKGSFQPILEATVDLTALRQRDPAAFDEWVRSETFEMHRSDLWVLERSVGNIDPQSHNVLTPDIAVVPDADRTLHPIDLDLTFPPVVGYRLLFGVREYLPARVRRAAYETLRATLADGGRARAIVAGRLTEPEIGAMFGRMRATLEIIENTIRLRGEAATFFPAALDPPVVPPLVMPPPGVSPQAQAPVVA